MQDRTLELLEKYLDADFKAFPMASDKTTQQDIDELEKTLGVKFPEEYKIHLLGDDDDPLGHRGIYVEVIEEIWKRPQPMEVGPFWSFLYGFHTYTAAKESTNWMRLEVAGKELSDDLGIKLVPILKVIGDPDPYCVDENGKIVIYRSGEEDLEEITMNFWEILEYELKELVERKERKKQEE